MIKIVSFLILFGTFNAFADITRLADLSEEDARVVTKEFSSSFVHTSVNAPETDGMWGLEVGAVIAASKSDQVGDIVDSAGGEGGDLAYIPNAGLMGRLHLGNLFVEATFLPEQETKDLKFKSSSYSAGWNFGRTFGLPLDIAVGYDVGSGDMRFSQQQDSNYGALSGNVTIKATTTSYWIGVSKDLILFTPYFKIGSSTLDREINATMSIFDYDANLRSDQFKSTGNYMVLGANFELLILKSGVEMSRVQDVTKYAVKFSIDI